mmetsp:Transcript_6502/g.14772  ORF Transcript_6502/g.14772 Transcript_6502/m.14772 type:complete len:278 (-) Transcript_6502:257-1090(-)
MHTRVVWCLRIRDDSFGTQGRALSSLPFQFLSGGGSNQTQRMLCFYQHVGIQAKQVSKSRGFTGEGTNTCGSKRANYLKNQLVCTHFAIPTVVSLSFPMDDMYLKNLKLVLLIKSLFLVLFSFCCSFISLVCFFLLLSLLQKQEPLESISSGLYHLFHTGCTQVMYGLFPTVLDGNVETHGRGDLLLGISQFQQHAFTLLAIQEYAVGLHGWTSLALFVDLHILVMTFTQNTPSNSDARATHAGWIVTQNAFVITNRDPAKGHPHGTPVGITSRCLQ